jgi:hypothetical protein
MYLVKRVPFGTLAKKDSKGVPFGTLTKKDVKEYHLVL